MKTEKPASRRRLTRREVGEPVVVTLGELVEAVSSVTDESSEVAAVVDHVLQSMRRSRRRRRIGA